MLNPYLRLMRFDKPIGIYLLLWPTLWALWLSSDNHPRLSTVCIFVLGTILMRAAGCIMNDLADRDIDPHVERTKTRPLAAGELSVKNALLAFIITLLLSALLLFFLPIDCFYLALLGAAITIIYPFCKRIIKTPQMILGFAFSFGIPMAYYANHNVRSIEMLVLMGLTYLWIVAYDTMYAMADKADDLKIGIHSTAIYFGQLDRVIIAVLQISIILGWFLIGWIHHVSVGFYYLTMLVSLFFVYQQRLIRKRVPASCFKAFLNNHWYGLAMWCVLLIG